MKKGLIALVLYFAYFSIVTYFFSGINGKLIKDEFIDWFKPTVSLECSLNVDDIQEVEVFSRDHVYTDKKTIKKLIDYLNEIPLAEATREELPNRSADEQITFYSASGRELGAYVFYGQVFIMDLTTEKLYRSKKDWLIEGVEKLIFD